MSEIEIRLAKTWEECVQCEELQKRVWEMPDYRDVVPANLLITALKNGGILVGAFDQNRMVGFAFGFLGSEGRRLKHTSHMLAVLPDLRVKGIGAQIKWFQRTEAVKQGLHLMTWTYDPLQAVNAHLNLTRLGAIARRYYRDVYGEMTDGINSGVPSDRFEAEWHLESERVKVRETLRSPTSSAVDAAPIYSVEWDSDTLPFIADENELSRDTHLIEIPADFQNLKTTNPALGVQWRQRTRATFERAFAAGYAACEVQRNTDENGRARVFYVLKKALEL